MTMTMTMTIISSDSTLIAKALLRRYSHIASFAPVAANARRITSILDAAGDRASAIAGFAKSLDPAEAKQLAALLTEQQ